MRIKILTLLLVLLWSHGFSQKQRIDSLMLALKNAPNDAVRYQMSDELYGCYEEVDRDSALYYAEMAIMLAKRDGQNLVLASSLSWKGYQLVQKGRYGDGLQCYLQAINIIEGTKHEEDSWLLYRYDKPETIRLSILARTHQMLGFLMSYAQNYEQAILQLREAKRIAWSNREMSRVGIVDMVLGRVYIKLNKLDSALIFAKNAEKIRLRLPRQGILSTIYWYQGNIYFLKGDMQTAKNCFAKGIKMGLENQYLSGLARNYFALTKLHLAEHEKDSSLFYALKGLETINVLNTSAQMDIDLGTAYENLYRSYLLRNQVDSTFKYQGLALAAKDSIYQGRINSISEFQKLSFGEQLRLQRLEKEKETYQNRLKQYAFLVGLGILLLVAFFLYRNNRQKQKANAVLEKTLSNLKSTQAQLIQSEKLASLGELTAGIAHEIQNPLNFVNNFAEVSAEMLDEMEEELDKGDTQEVKAIAADIKQNLSKINHHGQRASSIVKGMLEHSRVSTGVKEPTDLNALADEYLRLAYHGLRAKDNNFNATLETHFDPDLPLVSVIPQDIGRVLLNLINNAFYAVAERSRSTVGAPLAGAQQYIPTVTVSTKKLENAIEIRVQDNGNGIPESIREKIFQPFFTTKPTGQGTGLGLSLAYDIVTKGHGGNLEVKSKGKDGTKFIIQLPVNSKS